MSGSGRRIGGGGDTLATYVILTLVAFVFLAPLAWMFATSLKQESQVFDMSALTFPNPVEWQNYREAISVIPFMRYFFNTVVITGLTIVGTLLASSVAAYGFARLRFPGRNILFIVAISTMMVPGIVPMIPRFAMYKYLRWIDTIKPLVVPFFFGVPFHIFLFRQFFLTLPRDLEDAAKIDGASTFQIYWKIMLPLTKPALATVTIFTFMGTWNDFMGPWVYLKSQAKWTLSLGLASFQGQQAFQTPWHLLMAASLLVLVPALIIFFVAQKYFIRGIATGGIKG
jgi:ABC-type glycerol-3-phosphate transport system permease component